MKLDAYLRHVTAAVDQSLRRALPAETVDPATIHRAMRYSIFAGGKRLRPVLCVAAAEACGGAVRDALPAACAVECVHTYSLIHDDLPCMDDDDLRRGRPTSHKVFGEGIAVLAGDALLTLAFEILAKADYPTAQVVRILADAAGSRRLIAGQVADLEAEGRLVTLADVRFIHERKTAALLEASLVLGGISARADEVRLGALKKFGRNLGLAFQIIDDILDVTQTTEKLGKSAGKDVSAAKATYPAVLGMEAARREAHRTTRAARKALDPFGASAGRLHELADYLLDREF